MELSEMSEGAPKCRSRALAQNHIYKVRNAHCHFLSGVNANIDDFNGDVRLLCLRVLLLQRGLDLRPLLHVR
jgi:hypothetical protein